MNKRKLAFPLALLVMGGLVGLLAGAASETEPAALDAQPPPSAPEAQVEAPNEADYARLRRTVHALSRKVSELESAPEAPVVEDVEVAVEPEPRAPVTSAERAAQEQAKVRRIRDSLDEAFDAEIRDGAWAPEREAEVTRYFSSETEDPVGRLLSAECRTNFCRLAVDPQGVGLDAIGNIMHSRTFASSGYYTMDPDSGQLLLYVSREGVKLQNLDGFVAAYEARDG